MIHTSLALLFVVALSSNASAQWTDQNRTDFVGSCYGSCAISNVPPERPAWCRQACNCAADEGQKFMTPADMTAMTEAAKAGKTTPKGEQLVAIAQACLRKAMGR
jgi:hypothetical protein